MSRDELVAKGRSLGVERPELMTRVELGDEIVRRSQSDPSSQRSARGWLGIARDLVASVVESGLNLPDAAAVIRGERELEPKVPAPVATVTLAEIYATQGHTERALNMLNEVLAGEPEHAAAKALRQRLSEQSKRVARGAVFDAAPADAQAGAPSEPLDASASFAEALAPPLEWQASAPPIEAPSEVPAEPTARETTPSPADAAPPAAAEAPAIEAPTPGAAARPLNDALPAAPHYTLLVLRTQRPHPLLCWDVSTLTVPELGARLEVECLGFAVTHARPERREVALEIDSVRGAVPLPQFDRDTVVRAALGYRASGAFVPLAIGSELAVGDDAIDVRFRPPLADDESATAAERALAAEFAT